jgi:SAM-dependent methyltransferase
MRNANTPIVEVLSDNVGDFPIDWYEIAQEGHFWFEWRFQAFIKQLEDLKISKDEAMIGLDIGCGYGLVRTQIENHSSWTTDGADLNKKALEQNKSIGQTLLYNIHDCKKEYKERYDYILLFDVLEHIEDTQVFLNSVLFHLKKGGYVFVNVPALNNKKLSIYDKAVGHHRRYDKKMLSAELKTLNILDIRYWGLGLLPLLLLRGLYISKKTTKYEVIQKGLRPPKEWINQLLVKWMWIETKLLKNPLLGTSLLAAGRKNY